MKSKLISSLLIGLFILSAFAVYLPQASAITITQTVDISSAISGQALWITHNSVNNLAINKP